MIRDKELAISRSSAEWKPFSRRENCNPFLENMHPSLGRRPIVLYWRCLYTTFECFQIINKTCTRVIINLWENKHKNPKGNLNFLQIWLTPKEYARVLSMQMSFFILFEMYLDLAIDQSAYKNYSLNIYFYNL